MRDLKTVKETRDSLRNEYIKFSEVRSQMVKDCHPKDMNEYDKKLYGYIQITLSNLDNQIKTLTFVLNEDFELPELSINKHYNSTYGINKKTVMDKLVEDSFENGQFITR